MDSSSNNGRVIQAPVTTAKTLSRSKVQVAVDDLLVERGLRKPPDGREKIAQYSDDQLATMIGLVWDAEGERWVRTWQSKRSGMAREAARIIGVATTTLYQELRNRGIPTPARTS